MIIIIFLICLGAGSRQYCRFTKSPKVFTLLKEIWESPRVNENLTSVGFEPTTTEVKFSLTRGDSQISFKRVNTLGNLVYRQYCLLPAPKHIKKIIIIPNSRVLRGSHIYISLLFNKL